MAMTDDLSGFLMYITINEYHGMCVDTEFGRFCHWHAKDEYPLTLKEACHMKLRFGVDVFSSEVIQCD